MARKEYSRQFREEACRLVSQQGYSPAQAAKSLGMCENTLRYWLALPKKNGRWLKDQLRLAAKAWGLK